MLLNTCEIQPFPQYRSDNSRRCRLRKWSATSIKHGAEDQRRIKSGSLNLLHSASLLVDTDREKKHHDDNSIQTSRINRDDSYGAPSRSRGPKDVFNVDRVLEEYNYAADRARIVFMTMDRLQQKIEDSIETSCNNSDFFEIRLWDNGIRSEAPLIALYIHKRLTICIK
ncbi:hypothetical protein RB195_020025 [Necator americanus]|uniref:Uncharacterized protein n=1 Tax=Necator americanus TaxID=51031 RepID=A0ABR1CGU3_NECAM